ncbi:MAG: hypothetical protein IT306_25400 [Chloroflexi bacterium]|nr:hypothetical protein [Chloroflexota bacterium]
MFPTYGPWTRLLETTDPTNAGLGPLVAVIVVLILLVLKDATGGVLDAGSNRFARGLTIAVVPLAIAFLWIAGAQLLVVIR